MTDSDPLLQLLARHWGYSAFRPLQRQAMQAVLEGRDSLVVLPTGGGKSMCFQLPALALPGLAVVVSPLISLMKDQVDSLKAMGIEAACVNSSMSYEDRAATATAIRQRRLKLLYIAPERLSSEQTLEFLGTAAVSFFAIDEAHCISQWGHDFRKEYRQLSQLKSRFPHAAVHAYTATATQDVRQDILDQLHLSDPELLVGSFDRPNLVYRAARQDGLLLQVLEVIERHKGESGIVYAISRKKVEELAADLRRNGHKAVCYHAGLSDDERHAAQNAFQQDQADIVVATVAFGMGIDKSNVRFVIHAGMPKSLEHYQQEAGRAGRDGLEAECALFYSPGEGVVWRKLLGPLEAEPRRAALLSIDQMLAYCDSTVCRHQALVEHFDQEFDRANCGACDVCLGELELTPDALVISQKILSCVVRVKEGFGAFYVAQVLIGSAESKLLSNGHHQLTTYGLLKAFSAAQVRMWIEQLVSQGCLLRHEEYGTLTVTANGWQVLRNQCDSPKLRQPARSASAKAGKASKPKSADWSGVHEGLFEELRALRRSVAEAAGIPAFVVFGDATLRDLARLRPLTLEGFRQAHGIGDKKLHDYGETFVEAIRAYCTLHRVPTESSAAAPTEPARMIDPATDAVSGWRAKAFEMFAVGASLDDVSAAVQKARSTTLDALIQWIEQEEASCAEHWIDAASLRRAIAAGSAAGWEKLRPVFEALNGEVSYDDLKIIRACQRNAPAVVDASSP